MYRSPVLSLLHAGQISGVSEAFSTTTTNLRDQLDALHADAIRQNIAYFGGGRFVNSSAEASGATPAGAARDGGGLTIELPVNSAASTPVVWMVDGVAFTLDQLAGYTTGEDGGLIVLDNVPPGGTFYGYLSLDFDEDEGYSLVATWSSSADATQRRSGHPCIGKVTTDADSITAIDPGPADLIWSMAFLMAKINSLSTTGGGGGDGGGGGALFATQLPISPDDATDTKSYIDNAVADLKTSVEKLGAGKEPFPAPFDLLADEIAINRLGVGEVNPPAIERGQISVIGPNFGHGQADTPDFSPNTNDPLELPWNPVTGLFGT